jgi:hypothetical protein
MRPFKIYSLVACLIFSSLLFLPSFNLYATEYYALRLSGSNCILCHTDPKTGSLNQAGALFQEEGYRYLDLESIFLLLGTNALPYPFWLLSSIPALALWESWGEMESMEGEVEGPLPICFRTSDDIEETLPRNEPPSSFLVFPYLESFDSDRSYSGVYILSFVGGGSGFQNYPSFRLILDSRNS